MPYQQEHSSRRGARPDARPTDERDYQRRIDCAPRVAPRPSREVQVGRGRGTPEPGQWSRGRGSEA